MGEGLSQSEAVSQLPVGVCDGSLSSPCSCHDLSLSGGGGRGRTGGVSAGAALPDHCGLSLSSQDASGAGPGESVGLGPSQLPSRSMVTPGPL